MGGAGNTTEIELAKAPSDELGRRPDHDEAEPGGHIDVVDHVRVGEQVGDAHAHLALGEHDAVRPYAFEDGTVEWRPGLGNDVADAELLERHGREHARFALAADCHDRVVELSGADALERLEIGGVELQGWVTSGAISLTAASSCPPRARRARDA